MPYKPPTVRETSGSGSGGAPTQHVGPYELAGELGQGSTGTVYLARRPGIERVFALKLLSENLDPELVARCQRGAQLAARLEHPGIVRAIDIGSFQGRIYIVMDHVPGPTLEKQLESGPHPWREAVQLVAEIADALEVAHRAGVVHRDLKPGNVILDGRDGRAKITDFGIARPIGGLTNLTRSGDFLGTPVYMSPQQIEGRQVDARADVYALGVILYEMIAGSPPFAAGSVDELCRQIVEGTHTPLKQRRPEIPSSIDVACSRAMAREPGGRPPTAGAMARLLRDALSEVAAESKDASSVRVAGGRGGGSLMVPLLALWGVSLLGLIAWGLWEYRGRLRVQRELAAEQIAHTHLKSAVASKASDLGDLERRLETAERELKSSQSERRRLQMRHDAVDDKNQLLQSDLRQARAEAGRRRPAAGGGGSPGTIEGGGTGPAVIDWLIKELEGNAEAIYMRAVMLHDRGRFEECLRLIRSARAAGEEHPRWIALQARAESKGGDRAAASQSFMELARRAPPDSLEGRFGQVVTGQLKDPNQILDTLRSACEIAPRVAYIRVMLVNTLEQVALAKRDPSLLDEALRVAEEAVANGPTSYQAYHARSSARYHRWVLNGSKDPAEAAPVIADLKRARELHPDPSYSMFIGKSYLQMLQQPGPAIPELEEAIRLAQKKGDQQASLMSLGWLAKAHLVAGDRGKAEQLLGQLPPRVRAQIEQMIGWKR